MEQPEIIYPLDELDIIPVKAEEVVCFMNVPMIDEGYIWMTIVLKDGTYLSSQRYECSEADNLLRTLLTKKDFVLLTHPKSDFFLNPGGFINLWGGVRFSAITKIDKIEDLDYVDYWDPYAFLRKVVWGKVVESTVENYKKWKALQEEKNGGIRDNLPARRR